MRRWWYIALPCLICNSTRRPQPRRQLRGVLRAPLPNHSPGAPSWSGQVTVTTPYADGNFNKTSLSRTPSTLPLPIGTFPVVHSSLPFSERSLQDGVSMAQPDANPAATLSHPLDINKQQEFSHAMRRIT